jgi:ribonucleoside-diphosphate reductase alpha chain
MTFTSANNPMFRSEFSETIFENKYAHENCETWERLARTLVMDVCGDLLTPTECDELTKIITDLKFLPGGRYIYYAGRSRKFFNNCYLLKAEEDTREDWGELSWRAENCLMTGGGIGVDYSVYRRKGSKLGGTGGVASGPIPKMMMINEIGRNVMQGGSRRSAIYASLNWKHGDVQQFLNVKNWYDMPIAGTKMSIGDVKELDFNFPAPLDMTNVSVNYDTEWLMNFWKTGDVGDVFRKNISQAMSTAEPGFSFNFFEKENETLRNACTEVTSCDDSDVCNLGSVNLGRIETIDEFKQVVELATKFLVCGTLKAHLPYEKIKLVRQKNRRLGLGLMGCHEWLLKRGYRYEVTPELHQWLEVYRGASDTVADRFCDQLSISRPVAKRAIAPTGTIGILAGTSTGIEPIFAVAYKRRYLKEGTKWHYQYVVDSAAKELIELYGLDPDNVESAIDLAADYERRIKFQADVQDYVDQSISSTINLPKWGSRYNNEDTVEEFGATLAKYAHRLRGFTCYPDGARGGQPLVSVPYSEAVGKNGQEFEEAVIATHDVCSITGHGGSCGV